MKKVNMYSTISIMILVGIFFVFLKRAVLSVELTDEIHGIASIYNIYQGKVPFMTSWDYHTGWCLLVPLFAIFQFISPELEGVVLAFRLFYVCFIVFSFVAIVLLLKKYENRENSDKKFFIIWLSVAAGLFYVPYSLFQINYNTFTTTFLLIISIILYTSVREEKEYMHFFSMGILMALVCIMYPTLAVAAVLLILYLWTVNKNYYAKEKIFYYILGGCLVMLPFLFWIFSSGSIELFKEALNGMLSSPHETSKGIIDLSFIKQTFYLPFKTYILRRFTLFIFIFLMLQGFVHTIMKDRRDAINGILLLIFLIINAYCNKREYGYSGCGVLIGFGISAFFLKQKITKRYFILWACLLIFILTYSFTSDNKNVFVALEASGTMLFFYVSYCIGREFKGISKNMRVSIILVLALSGILNLYTYVYGDAPVRQLTEYVDYGIYKGLYTTKERKNLVIKVEKILQKEISPLESVCAVTRAPMIYPMTRSEICAPQTWDAQFLARGYTSAAPLLDYYKAVNKEPDVLVATTLDIPDFYNNNKYEINEFIDARYKLFYTNDIEGIQIYLWRRNGI